MKLSEVGEAVAEYDKAMAAKSFGPGIGTLGRAVEALPLEEKKELSEFLKNLLEKAARRTAGVLEDLGFDVGSHPDNMKGWRK